MQRSYDNWLEKLGIRRHEIKVEDAGNALQWRVLAEMRVAPASRQECAIKMSKMKLRGVCASARPSRSAKVPSVVPRAPHEAADGDTMRPRRT